MIESFCKRKMLNKDFTGYEECLYWDKCLQTKKQICISYSEHCIINQRFKVLDRTKPRTGLERFIDRYGEDWRMIAFGEQGYIPETSVGI